MAKKMLAFDLGASSGRAMLGTLENGKIKIEEIHRFSNDPVMIGGTLHWDILRLFFEIKQGISKAVALGGGFDSIGIDTWGVDFGLLDKEGRLLQNPVHYRDARTEGVPEKVYEKVSKDELFSRTGIQFMRINTLYQLYYLAHSGGLEGVDKLLFIPDLLAYFLTGEQHAEYTVASTSNLLNPHTRDWDQTLLEKLGIPSGIFPSIIEPGSTYGMLSKGICEELGCKPVPVVAVGEHDTASAVAAVPSKVKHFAYISSGTWSLLGTELDKPVVSDDAARANFTNEGGYNNKIRFIKNIMGLWLIQESRRQWQREGQTVSFNDLEREALDTEPFESFIDPDAPLFEAPGNMPERIRKFCRETGQPVPESRGAVMRCIYQSLAMKYKYAFETMKSLTGYDFEILHIVGGGIKDTFLCKMAAGACGVMVNAGPAEATVIGNIAVQLIAAGELADLKDARKAVRAAVDIQQFAPHQSDEWEMHYPKFKGIAGL
ncbi:MAG: rhamnulokinase family protein [Bacillota bacterium]|nr:rhamnulokinase family protein [Bacillota bacterium]